jgi:xylulose-5-phosphate/fructose-6-phosphate phosphoketolase
MACFDPPHAQGIFLPLHSDHHDIHNASRQGWSGPKVVNGTYVEGSFRSHQVPLPNAKTSPEELAQLQEWLESYHPEELFNMGPNGDGKPSDTILKIIPKQDDKKLGQRRESYAAYTALKVPDWMPFGVKKSEQESCMKAIGRFLRTVVKEYVQIFFLHIFRAKPDAVATPLLSGSSLRTSWCRINWTPFSRKLAAISNGT